MLLAESRRSINRIFTHLNDRYREKQTFSPGFSIRACNHPHLFWVRTYADVASLLVPDLPDKPLAVSYLHSAYFSALWWLLHSMKILGLYRK